MNGSPKDYGLERLERADGKRFVYRYQGDDSAVPDHRLCAPCWNIKELTVVLHEEPAAKGHATLKCPNCEWETNLKQGS